MRTASRLSLPGVAQCSPAYPNYVRDGEVSPGCCPGGPSTTMTGQAVSRSRGRRRCHSQARCAAGRKLQEPRQPHECRFPGVLRGRSGGRRGSAPRGTRGRGAFGMPAVRENALALPAFPTFRGQFQISSRSIHQRAHRPAGGCVICFRSRQAGVKRAASSTATAVRAGPRTRYDGGFKATRAGKHAMCQPGFRVLAGNGRWRDFELMEQVFLTQTLVATF